MVCRWKHRSVLLAVRGRFSVMLVDSSTDCALFLRIEGTHGTSFACIAGFRPAGRWNLLQV